MIIKIKLSIVDSIIWNIPFKFPPDRRGGENLENLHDVVLYVL